MVKLARNPLRKVMPLILHTQPMACYWSNVLERLLLNYIFCLFVFYRYLATGDSFKTISFSYRVGHCTVARIVGEVCKDIWDCLVTELMPVPLKDDWRAIADGFLQEWNFPNCVGSIDGKHVVVQAPSNSGSLYFNYKHTFSIVLLAAVDAHYMFRMVDVGGYGRNSHGGTLANSPFGQALRDGTLDLPEDRVIPGAEHGPTVLQPHTTLPWHEPRHRQAGI